MSKASTITSSLLSFARYDDENGLLVRFNNGRLYRYPKATEDIYDAIVASDTPGGTFHKLVRSAGLAFEEVDE